MNRRIGLLGGTFDPPHVGHLIAAECARVALELDEVRFVVAGAPWMKHEAATAAQRVEMTALSVADDRSFVVDDCEVLRHGPTYTVDTLRELRDRHPEASLWFLAGADALAKLDRWHEPEACLELATFVCLTRPGYDLDLSGPLLGRVQCLHIPPVGISSTDLRRRFAAGEAVRHQLPVPAERYVRAHGLYRSDQR